MKFYFLTFLALISQLCNAQNNSSPPGYEISIEIKPLKNTPIYLGHYLGSNYVMDDTALLNEKSQAIFKNNKKLPGGIYFVGFPAQNGTVDLLVDDQQNFSVLIDITDPKILLVKFTNSPENDLFNQYRHYMGDQSVKITTLQQRLDNAANTKDSADIIHQLSELDKVIQKDRTSIIEKNPGSFLSSLLAAIKDVELPDNLKHQQNLADSQKAHAFIRQHYWDGVNFWDGRLVYTPFFETKLDHYFKDVIDLKADSVIKELDRMLGYATGNKIMMQYLLPKLLYGSMYHTYKWDESVYIHLFEKFIANKQYDWLTDNERKTFTNRAYFLMGNEKGKKAPDIILPGTDGQKLSLLQVSAKYTVLCFWDPTCHHCIETLPKLDSIYRNKWKQAGVKLFSVAVETDGNEQMWKQYIQDNALQDWTNVYNSFASEKEMAAAGKQLYLQDYDVWYYPSFFLLDNEKRMMAKKLNYTQMVELLETVLNKK